MPGIVPPSFDALVLAAVARDVGACLGARFAGVGQPDPETVVVSLRDGRTVHHLHCSIRARTARVHLGARPDGGERPGPFGLLLRSRLAEARLAGVEQPPFDRVLRLGFEALEGPLLLIAEVMGRHSNLILAGDRAVLGALKVVTARMSPRRPVLPGRPYSPPPADRPRPDALDEPGVLAICEGAEPLWRRIAGAVIGLGPGLAREVALRAGVEPETPASEAADAAPRLRAALRELAEVRRTQAFAPTLYESAGRIVAFAAIPLRMYAGCGATPAGSMSEAVDRYYRERETSDPIEDRRRAAAAAVRTALRHRERALEHNRDALAESARAGRLRLWGELVLTYGSQAAPRATSLTVPDYTAGGAPIVIPLEPGLTPAENARRLFRQYAKAQAGARALPARITRLESEILLLREAIVQIETAQSADDLLEVQSDLIGAKVMRASRRDARRGGAPAPARSAGRRRAAAPRAAARSAARRFWTPDGGTILAGRSGRENDHITFHLAGPDDLWFHARGLAGAHVVLKAVGRPSSEAVAAAAGVAAYFSEGRTAGEVAVDYTARKHVGKPRGAGPGAVTYTEERTVRAAPRLPAPPSGRRPLSNLHTAGAD